MSNFIHSVWRAGKGAVLGWISSRSESPHVLARLLRDEAGVQLILVALLLPVFIGVAALGTESGLWAFAHMNQQGAADSAAMSATVAFSEGESPANMLLEAEAISAQYGYVNGTSGVTVTVNNPPLADSVCPPDSSYVGNTGAVEVLIEKPYSPLLSGYWSTSSVYI